MIGAFHMGLAIMLLGFAAGQKDAPVRTDILQRIGFAIMVAAKQDGLSQQLAMEVLARLPAADLSGLRDRLPSEADGSNVIALRPGGVAGMVAALADPKVVGPEVAGLIGEARRALRGVGRSGFAPEDRRSVTAVNGMAAGAPLVRRLLVRLQNVRSAAEARLREDSFDQDAVRFRAGFRALYGGAA